MYAFAKRDGKAVGFVGWGLTSPERAEAWIQQGTALKPEEVLNGPCVLIFGLQAISADMTRFLVRQLRDVVFPEKQAVYFIRDYGVGPDGKRRQRAARLHRPPRTTRP